MQKHLTNKLFYDKYLYKIVIINSLSHIFRNKNFRYAVKILDKLQQDYESGRSLQMSNWRKVATVDENTFIDARNVYSWLKSLDDYMMRIEYNAMSLYSNNKPKLLELTSIVNPKRITSFHEPSEQYKGVLHPGVIIIDDDDFAYQYKVTLGNTTNCTGFANWASVNSNQVKIGDVALNALAQNQSGENYYFYARDEKTLQLCNLMLNKIRRIDKIIKRTDLDK